MKSIIKFIIVALSFVLANNASAESKDVTMQVGETQTLYLPTSVTSKNLKSVNFYSNGISYVQVTSHTNYSVTVKAIKAFSSPIIVRCDYYYFVRNGNYTYETKGFYDFNITVVGDNKVKPTNITFPSSVVALEVGESRQLTPTVYPANAEYTLTWSINDRSVATVSQDGFLTGKSEGAADLTVKADNGVYAMLRVVVSKPAPSSVSVKPTTLDLKVGDEKYLTASVYPTSANQKVTWTSSDTNVATVSSGGRVTATGSGSCTITAKTSNNRTATCAVKVSPKEILPTSISLNPEAAEIEVGETIRLSPVIFPDNATTILKWVSSDNLIASVNNGEVTGLSEGICSITATTTNGLCASSSVVVKAKEVLPTSVSLSVESLNMTTGQEVILSVSIYPENATSILTWKSSDPEIATIEDGRVKAINEGSCDITVSTQNGICAICHVVVEKPIVLPESIVLMKTAIKMVVGENTNLEVQVLPTDAVVELKWESSDTDIALVDKGLVTSKSDGECVITVSTQNGLTAECHVSVEKQIILPESIELSPTSLTLVVGEVAEIIANVLPTDATFEAMWNSSDETVASVHDGEIKALSKGRCIITMTTQNGLSALCNVIVKDDEPIVEPSHDWSGRYQMKAKVDCSESTGYIYPEEFVMEIEEGTDGAYCITSFIGFDVAKSYPYTGLKLNFTSNTEATIDLDYNNDAGGWTVDDKYTDGLHLLSANSKYDSWDLGNISLTRNGDNEITISDFYVYYFGIASNFEYSREARYANCATVNEFTGLDNINEDGQDNDTFEIYSLGGKCIYIGNDKNVPMLEAGIYIVKKGNKTIKFFKSN